MNLLRNISIKMKLFLIFIVPALALTYQIFSAVLDKNKIVNEEHTLAISVELATKISALVHETQKERGATAGYLGSGGKKFGDVLSSQRINTDAKFKELQVTMDENDLSELPSLFVQGLKSAISKLNNVGNIRKNVSSLSVSKKEAISFYTTTNGVFLDAISDIAKYSNDPEILKELSAYTNFLYAKERAGVERAVGAGAFSSNSISSAQRIKFNNLIAEQNSFIKSFKIIGSDKDIEFYNQTMQGSIIDDVVRMRNALLNSDNKSDFGVDASVWFKTITKKINLLKNVDDKLAVDLLKHIKEIQDKESYALKFLIIFGVLILLISGVLGFIVSTAIVTSLNDILKTAKDLSSGDGDLTKRLNITSKDEIGDVASEINMFIQKVQTTIDAVKQGSTENASVSEELHGSSDSVKDNISKESEIISKATVDISSISSSLLSSVTKAQRNYEQVEKASTDLLQVNNKINELSEKISQTSETEQEMASKLEELSNNATEVKNVLSVIGDIADQTNLLALNAAIEAARAGEHGRGFAVVADEVRKLAENTQKSLSEINASISVIVQSILEASGQMNENAQTIVELVGISNDVESVIASSNDVMQEVLNDSSIAMKDSQKMSDETSKISNEINHINDISNKNLNSVEEITEASLYLSTMSSELNMQLDKFKT